MKSCWGQAKGGNWSFDPRDWASYIVLIHAAFVCMLIFLPPTLIVAGFVTEMKFYGLDIFGLHIRFN
jgi:hypothetical protein